MTAPVPLCSCGAPAVMRLAYGTGPATPCRKHLEERKRAQPRGEAIYVSFDTPVAPEDEASRQPT